MEIVTDFDGNAYRTVYTAKIGSVVYVLHEPHSQYLLIFLYSNLS